jgi:hypothetical protein
MLRRTTVRDETDRARLLVLPTDVLRWLPQDMAVAVQTSVEAARMPREALDRNSMEAGPHLDLAHLVPPHRVEITLAVAK